MTDRDWSKEMAKIDKQLTSVSDEALFPEGSGLRPADASKTQEPGAPTRKPSSVGAFLRLTLAVLLGIAILFWPYQARCGFGLAAYLAAVAVVAVSGVWSAIWTWRHRTGRAHTLSLLIIVWGLLLASIEVLPRLGYAKPDVNHPAAWTCG